MTQAEWQTQRTLLRTTAAELSGPAKEGVVMAQGTRHEYEKIDGFRAVVAGALLTHLRERRRWAQGEVAQRTGLLQTTLSRYEQGVVALLPHRVFLLARAYGVSVEVLHARLDVLVSQLHKRLARDLGKLPATTRDVEALRLLGAEGVRALARYLCAVQEAPASRPA